MAHLSDQPPHCHSALLRCSSATRLGKRGRYDDEAGRPRRARWSRGAALVDTPLLAAVPGLRQRVPLAPAAGGSASPTPGAKDDLRRLMRWLSLPNKALPTRGTPAPGAGGALQE